MGEYCAGDQGLNWAVEPRRETDSRNRNFTETTRVDLSVYRSNLECVELYLHASSSSSALSWKNLTSL
jgi:hypothetical protein